MGDNRSSPRGFSIPAHGRCRLSQLNVTAHWMTEWIVHRLTEACHGKLEPKSMNSDHDRVYDELKMTAPAKSIRDFQCPTATE